MALESPELFDAPFCVAIQVTGADMSLLRQERTYPAQTVVIETVFPNIPAGENRTVELGIYRDGSCDPTLATADWSGRTDGVTVRPGEVTLVPMILRPGGQGTDGGSIVIRGQAVTSRELHAEVVDVRSTPIPSATCDILEGMNQLGTAVSGATASDLGIIDTEVEAPAAVTELLLRCTHPGFLPTAETAQWVSGPTGGTFVATVIMRPRVQILVSTPTRLQVQVNVEPLTLSEVLTPAGPFQRVVAAAHPGLSLDQENVSTPEVPRYTAVVAAPLDGALEVVVRPGDQGTVREARLYPVQPDVRDPGGEGAPPEDDVPFVFDPRVYQASDAEVGKPRQHELQSSSDGRFVAVSMPVVDYQPGSGLLRQYSSLIVDISFSIGQQPCFRLVRTSEEFSMDQVDRRIEDAPSALAVTALNRNVLLATVCPVIIPPLFFGARFLIITHPSFLAAANDLATHKRSRGLSTAVVTTTTTGATAAQIRAYVQNAYNTWWIRPRWLLLMGDSEFIPTHYPGPSNLWDGVKNGGDQYYGQFGGGSTSVPLLGIGRFPVDTLPQAQAIVDKVKAFENSPPGYFNQFYDRYTFAAQFQDDNGDGLEDRTFARVSEIIRSHLTGQGWNVQRIYRDSPTTSPTTWYDGVAVPWFLRKPVFPWNGTGAEVTAAFNDGRALVFHRDHGWWSGWGTPSFSTSSLGSVSVSGNEFPLVLSINCASGIFDNESAETSGQGYSSASAVYWAESFLRKSDGALAVIGDQRSSGSTINSDLSRGLFDAMFPALLPYGSPAPIRKLGDVLNAGKGYLTTLSHSATQLAQQMTIYNLLGDPTVAFRTQGPLPIIVVATGRQGGILSARIPIPEVGPRPCTFCPPPVEFVPQELTVVAQDQQGNVLGRGIPGPDGQVSIPLSGTTGGEVVLTVSGDSVETARAVVK